jgi:hypothetical protein
MSLLCRPYHPSAIDSYIIVNPLLQDNLLITSKLIDTSNLHRARLITTPCIQVKQGPSDLHNVKYLKASKLLFLIHFDIQRYPGLIPKAMSSRAIRLISKGPHSGLPQVFPQGWWLLVGMNSHVNWRPQEHPLHVTPRVAPPQQSLQSDLSIGGRIA